MTNKKEVNALFPDGSVCGCSLQYTSSPPWRISVDCGVDGVFTSEAEDLFEAYKDIRVLLQEKNILLLCNGSRENIYPSQMLRQSGGRMAYVLRLGVPARKDDIVNIFDLIDSSDIETIEKQNSFYEDWLNSLDPTSQEIAEAKKHPDGWVYRIDGVFGENEKVPPSAIIGAWKVNSVGKITNVFKVNNNFSPL